MGYIGDLLTGKGIKGLEWSLDEKDAEAVTNKFSETIVVSTTLSTSESEFAALT